MLGYNQGTGDLWPIRWELNSWSDFRDLQDAIVAIQINQIEWKNSRQARDRMEWGQPERRFRIQSQTAYHQVEHLQGLKRTVGHRQLVIEKSPSRKVVDSVGSGIHTFLI